jgi:uncharacterized protein YdiU (UPF0061 family)
MTLFFRRLADWNLDGDAYDTLRDAYYGDAPAAHLATLAGWTRAYAERARIDDDDRRARMNEVHPLYVPRNYLVQEVIEATERGDRGALAELLDVLRRPYTEQPGRDRFAAKRPEWARHRPGCSMLSCSS